LVVRSESPPAAAGDARIVRQRERWVSLEDRLTG
jgi:hypothetical protein